MSNPRADIPVETIPACLRERAQWVVWRYVQRDGKPTKCPFNARTGAMADSTDASTWSSFDQAIAGFEADKRLEGLGFVFASDDPYCGIDLDDCIDTSTGEMKPWGQRLIDLLDSYSEISPSGTGVKVIVEGAKPGPRCKKAFEDGEVEMYDHDRFFTITARHLAGTPSAVNPRQSAVEAIYTQVFNPAPPAPAPAAPVATIASPALRAFR